MPRPFAAATALQRWRSGALVPEIDELAGEEPLQLLVDGEELSVIMRTPGADVELALGLLWAEAVIDRLESVSQVLVSAEAPEVHPGLLVIPDALESNLVDVRLRPGSGGRRPHRSLISSSACGICGATTREDLRRDFPEVTSNLTVAAEVLASLPDRLRQAQAGFASTGALHAAGLFTAEGEMLVVREDVGRHNAVDKVVGWALLHGRLPAARCVLVVSGRVGFEVVQKAIAAGIPVLAAVGAPSTLAVATAADFGVTLAGFIRDGRFNVYSASHRVQTGPPG